MRGLAVLECCEMLAAETQLHLGRPSAQPSCSKSLYAIKYEAVKAISLSEPGLAVMIDPEDCLDQLRIWTVQRTVLMERGMYTVPSPKHNCTALPCSNSCICRASSCLTEAAFSLWHPGRGDGLIVLAVFLGF